MARMGPPAEQIVHQTPNKLYGDDPAFVAFAMRNEVRAANNASQFRRVFYEGPASKVRSLSA
jgi:hypothetical protein